MAINDFFQSIIQAVRGKAGDSGLSRRDMLTGIGFFGGLAAAGPLLMPGTANAVELLEDASDLDGEVTLAGSHGRRRRRSSGRRRRRPRRRTHAYRRAPARRYARPHYYTRRYAYSDIHGRCAYDRWFRRNNPGLCRRVLGMSRPHRGACFSLRLDGAAFSICG